MATTLKGFIKDWSGKKILPITRGELVLDKDGNSAFNSRYFEAGYVHPDGSVNTYGLISAAEKALITGGSTGQGIQDIYNKLQHLNEGFLFNDNVLKLYDSEGNSTPIKIYAETEKGINLVATGNNIDLSLVQVNSQETSIAKIIRGITVDKYGRVTSVTGGEITNDDLTGKTITNGILSGCTTAFDAIENNNKAIVNKAYVDKKFSEVTGMATGALKFGGSLSDAITAENKLTDINNLHTYFKVTNDFNLSVTNLFDTSGITTSSVNVKIGDTLIVHSEDGSSIKFVYIPSGDDITSITISKDGEDQNILNSAIGNIELRFSSIFSVINSSEDKNIYISLPQVSDSNDGYLSAGDYQNFKSYASSLLSSYKSETFVGDGVYKLGTFTVGNTTYDVIGKNNVSSLSLNDGLTDAFNPVLKFTETGASDVEIALRGASGILIKRDGNNIDFIANNVVNADSDNYLSITEGHKFDVKLGSIDSATGKVTEGLVNYSTVHHLATQVATTTVFEEINYSLHGTDASKYQYGNTKLKEAITVTI